jgi:hypothetical protein
MSAKRFRVATPSQRLPADTGVWDLHSGSDTLRSRSGYEPSKQATAARGRYAHAVATRVYVFSYTSLLQRLRLAYIFLHVYIHIYIYIYIGFTAAMCRDSGCEPLFVSLWDSQRMRSAKEA